MKDKLKEWALRYLPPEITGIVCGLGGAWLCHIFGVHPVVTAFVGTWGENVGFYAYAVVREVRAHYAVHRGKDRALRVIAWKSLRNLLLEFGVAEGLDSFVVRPFLLYVMPLVLGNFPLGVFVGMMIANVGFYVLSIAGYEMRKKWWGQG